MRIKHILSGLSALALSMALSYCTETPAAPKDTEPETEEDTIPSPEPIIEPEPVIPFSFALADSVATVGYGKSFVLEIRDLRDSSLYDVASNPEGLLFSSSDDAVATVDSLGKVSAVDFGGAVITVRCSVDSLTTLEESVRVSVVSNLTQVDAYDGAPIIILAWYSLLGEYVTHERYAEMDSCGFNVSFSHFNALADVRKALEASEGTRVKILAKCNEFKSDPSHAIPAVKDHPQLFGYHMQDEPVASQFAALRSYKDTLTKYDPDPKHWKYANLLPNKAKSITTTYSEYLDDFAATVEPAMISYDNYPLKKNFFDKNSSYYENFELAYRKAKAMGVPLWAFVCSVRHEQKKDSSPTLYPQPTLAGMRLQAFSDLAYGAQAVQYFTYASPVEDTGWYYYDAPLGRDYNKTEVWEFVRTINRKIQNLAWVFSGCEVVSVMHTGTNRPAGTTAYKSSLLPAPFTALTSAGYDTYTGLIVSHIKNGDREFLVLVNRDYKAAHRITVTFQGDVVMIGDDGKACEAPRACDLGAGDMIVYQFK